jgi:predicted ester cyclase
VRASTEECDERKRYNAAAVRCLVEQVLGDGRFELLPGLVASDYEGHFPLGDHYGPEGVRIDATTYRDAFPDLTVTLDDLFTAGDKVVRRFTLRGTHQYSYLGVPASGRTVALRGLGIDRLAGGMLVESWVQVDRLA